MLNVIIKKDEPLTESRYETLTINGCAETEIPLEVDNVTVNGVLRCLSDITCKELFVANGSTRFAGGINLKNLFCSGSVLSVSEHTFKATNANISGSVKICSDLVIDTLNITNRGSFTIRNDSCIKARSINSEGSLTINDTIEAETVNSFGFIYADTIIAKSIYIRFKKTAVSKDLKVQGIDITIPTIIADEVELVNVAVEDVRAKNVKIGANCRIGKVQYSKSLEIDESATVEEIEKREKK